MKSFVKKFFSIFAVMLMAICCFSFTACADIKKIEVNFSVYNFVEEELEERTFTIKLYRHLAPKTVDSIIENVANKSYYNGVTAYILSNIEREDSSEGYASQIMLGDLIFDVEKQTYVQNPISVDFVHGEFEANGVKGSDLKNIVGSVGLWRTKSVNETYTNNKSANTGKATMYMPTETLSSRNGYFCVFGTFDTSKESVSDSWDLIRTSINISEYRTNYVVYYTGEYNADDSVLNNGLTFNCVTETEYNQMSASEKEKIFKPEGEEYACYFPSTIRASFYEENGVKKPAVTIKSITIK
ncbi:MAG: hypothetical protein J6Q32_01430 [Clostridia bacterium]|nr:hypothetical protein [Clostridia bacterium]